MEQTSGSMVFVTEILIQSDRIEDYIDEIKHQLSQSKVVKIVPRWHIPDLRSYYDNLAEALGETLNIAEDFAKGGAQTGERWMEIRYDEAVPDMAAYRHSKNGQPLHTDESYIADPADVMVFYCVNRAPQGGATLFVDGVQLVNRMKDIAPELLANLTELKVTYEKAGQSRTEKIIDLTDAERPQFNFNYYCISPHASEEEKRLNQEFFDFLETHVKGSYLEVGVDLNPGEGVLWWDHLVLHGRRPFEARKDNDRFIWKTGIKFA
jgi:alpha-ketoglutarate-dependent taurine dioxygenase